MSLYEMFGTDPDLERNGVVIDYGTTRVTLARAGGANKHYQKVMQRLLKPYRRAITMGTMDEDRAAELLREGYVEANIKNWEELNPDSGEWETGVRLKDGRLHEFTPENVKTVLRELPDVFDDIQKQANDMSLYRRAGMEADAGN